jgi:hypothetical protein
MEHVVDMKRKKNEDWMIQAAVRLPRELQERLKRAGGERGMGEEIRRRLEASFEAEKPPANPKTRELLDAISFVAEQTDDYYGNWAEDPFAFEVAKACVELLLAERRPKGEAAPHPTEFAEIVFAPDHSPKPISQVFVSMCKDRARRAAEEKRR